VNVPGDDFLADAGFASNQDFGIGARGALDVRLEEANRFALTDELHFGARGKRQETMSFFEGCVSGMTLLQRRRQLENRRDADILQVRDLPRQPFCRRTYHGVLKCRNVAYCT
jgi:hypothetical protein